MLLRSEDSLKTTTSGPDRHQSQQTQSLSHQGPFQPNQPRHCQSRSQQHFQNTPVQRKPEVLSALEEAGLVLHRVRRQKKVLEENLDALLRAQSGEVLHLQLDALATNRDWREEVRIKKTVDAWINTSTIQEETSSGSAMTSQQRAAGSSANTGRGRPGNVLRATGSERAGGRGSRGQMPGAEPDSATGESYLTRLYGRAPYEGLRRTLKKSPYLRFSSPVSRLSRKPRPRLVESVTGVKVKSRKTQTSPGRPQDCDIISSFPLTCGDLTESPAVRGSVAMAIPLGRPRTDAPSVRLAEHRQEVTSPPVAPSAYCVVAADDRASEPQRVEQLEAPPPLNIIENKSEEEEFNEDSSPGTEFLSVADVVQQKELSFEGEEEVQLDGGPSPPLVLYQGPVFPPQIRSVLHTTDQVSVQDLDLQRDVLENRLVEWVQQQLMSRIISEMYPPSPSDPGQKGPADQSESTEQSAAPDPVAAAGGLQLFVDSNMSVNSALIRQLVSEVLTEQVALLLGQSDSLDPEPEPPEPGPRSHKEEELVPLSPAPVPTPQHSSREATPPPSEPTSMLNDKSPQPITAAELVAAPTSLEPAPSAGSPSAVHGGSPSAVHAGSPPAVHQAPPPLSWENVELPLDEERPEDYLETRSNLLVMSVAEEEPLFFSPVPPPYVSPPPSPAVLPRGPDPRPEPESPLPRGPDPRPASSSSSSEESCSTVTAETEAALKHISEGELLLCVHQLAATAEDVFSFSSSLQEIQEMDFDPTSEGQVRDCDLWKSKKGARRRDQGEEVRQSGTEQDSSCSPGQIRSATNQSSVAVGDLMAEPIRTLTSELQTDGSLSPLSPPHLDDTLTAAQSGVMREEVHLPFITREEEEEEEVSVAAETNSSTDDVF
ncbi:kiaa0586 [Pungitius sinensis]